MASSHSHKKHAHHIPGYVTVFINLHVAKAREISRRTRIPVSIILAQAAEESSWGRTAPDNAFFGIKGKSPS
jgi:flagellum-specific peptidoglycan hydrolase FlgJ